jgi:hypothetical protein
MVGGVNIGGCSYHRQRRSSTGGRGHHPKLSKFLGEFCILSPELPIWYDELGNGKNLDGTLVGVVGKVTSWTNVGLATPFALSTLLPPEVYKKGGKQ